MADLSLKEYENLILSSLEEAQQMDTKAQTEALMKKTGEDRKSWLSQFYDSLFGKTSEATIEPFQTEPLAPIIPDQAVMMEMAQIAAPLQNSPTLDMYQGMDVDNTEDVTQAQADRLRASLDAQIAMPTDSGATETAMVDVTDSDMGKLSSPEPLYKMAEEIDPGTIDTKELGLMSKPVKKNSLLEFIASGEGGYDSANRGTIPVKSKEGTTTDKIVGSQLVASRGGKKISELTVDEILKYQAIKDPNNKDRLFAVGKYQTDNRTFPMAVKALGLSGDTVFTPEVQEKVGLYLVSEKPGRKRLSNYLKNIGDVSAERAMLDLAMEFASVPVPYAIKKGKYGKWPKTDLEAGDSFYASGGKGGNKAQHTVAETLKVLEENKGSVPSANTRGVSPRPRLRDDE